MRYPQAPRRDGYADESDQGQRPELAPRDQEPGTDRDDNREWGIPPILVVEVALGLWLHILKVGLSPIDLSIASRPKRYLPTLWRV